MSSVFDGIETDRCAKYKNVIATVALQTHISVVTVAKTCTQS